MPMISISRLDGELVYEGEGELVMGPGGWFGSPGQVAIRQEERRGAGVLSRQLDISSLVLGTRAEYRVSEGFRPPPVIDFDPAAEPSLRIDVPELDRHWELRVDLPEGALDYLRSVLEEPLETPGERLANYRAWHEAREEAMRSARLAPPPVSYRDLICQAFGIDPSLVQSAEEAQIDLSTSLAQMAEARERAGLGLSSLAEAFQRNEDAITSARAEFPHDPYGYGRIYPGDQGTSRWTPPEDPDEKIRSCP